MKYLIYGIKYVPENKIVYVGCTSRSLNVRIAEHLTDTYKFTKRKNELIHQYMATKSINDFEYIVLEEFEGDTYLASEKEMKWISYYNTITDGYNMRPGGIDTHYISSEIEDNTLNLYLNENLKIKEISERVGIDRHSVSRTLARKGIYTSVKNKELYGNDDNEAPWTIIYR